MALTLFEATFYGDSFVLFYSTAVAINRNDTELSLKALRAA
jgi:hypothetical protein